MLKYYMRCPNCDHNIFYTLKTGQVKCTKCKRKFSIKKFKRDDDIVNSFCNDKTINQTAKELNLNYITVKKRYEEIRKVIVPYLENEYTNKGIVEYDEYIYLEQSKKKVKENIFDAQNFLTFNYENKVYNLLMPNLHRYKNEFLDDGLEEVYFNGHSPHQIKTSPLTMRNI